MERFALILAALFLSLLFGCALPAGDDVDDVNDYAEVTITEPEEVTGTDSEPGEETMIVPPVKVSGSYPKGQLPK